MYDTLYTKEKQTAQLNRFDHGRFVFDLCEDLGWTYCDNEWDVWTQVTNTLYNVLGEAPYMFLMLSNLWSNLSVVFVLASRKHTYIILTPLNPPLYSKLRFTGAYTILLILLEKHRWVLVRTVSPRRF